MTFGTNLKISSVELLSSAFTNEGGRVCLRVTCSITSRDPDWSGAYAILIVDTEPGGYPATTSVWIPPRQVVTTDVTVQFPPEAGMPGGVCVWGLVRPAYTEVFTIDPYLHRPASAICVATGAAVAGTHAGTESASGMGVGMVVPLVILGVVGAGLTTAYLVGSK